MLSKVLNRANLLQQTVFCISVVIDKLNLIYSTTADKCFIPNHLLK